MRVRERVKRRITEGGWRHPLRVACALGGGVATVVGCGIQR